MGTILRTAVASGAMDAVILSGKANPSNNLLQG